MRQQTSRGLFEYHRNLGLRLPGGIQVQDEKVATRSESGSDAGSDAELRSSETLVPFTLGALRACVARVVTGSEFIPLFLVASWGHRHGLKPPATASARAVATHNRRALMIVVSSKKGHSFAVLQWRSRSILDVRLGCWARCWGGGGVVGQGTVDSVQTLHSDLGMRPSINLSPQFLLEIKDREFFQREVILAIF